ncbi:Bgt-20208 [Blumeria graminis f. sp. tritici]|uniref:Bgt-20208 n=2 Tax=Blumeria graminis f. sp. tritici TaxID=62690 RepID=A0A9X9L8P1_BLUGR|nr:Bgt-20208 [Blumeria graminis f. sp. tritici]
MQLSVSHKGLYLTSIRYLVLTFLRLSLNNYRQRQALPIVLQCHQLIVRTYSLCRQFYWMKKRKVKPVLTYAHAIRKGPLIVSLQINCHNLTMKVAPKIQILVAV